MGANGSASRSPYVGWSNCTPSSDPASAENIFDAYRIGDMLGSGTFAQVRKCWPVGEGDSDEQYAVKIVDTMSEVFRHASSYISAQQEANILNGLRHPYIVELMHVFQHDRWLFMVLEMAPGGELFSAFANPETVVTEACVAFVGRQLLVALEYLHKQSVVHRDVKAENIMLAADPARSSKWHIKLVDFGLAMRMEQPPCFFDLCRAQELPLEELICGTAYYCAPEVWVNDYSPKVDVWAAGVVLYLALHGTFPFYDHDAGFLESLICNLERRPPFRVVCQKECPDYEISEGARQALSALLTKEQEERPCAGEALLLPWINTSAGTVPSGRSRLTLLGSAAECDKAAPRPCEEDVVPVPLPIRAKAGRAAQRPQVDPGKEQSRTKALEALQRRAYNTSRARSFTPAGDLSDILRGPKHRYKSTDGSAPGSARGETARLAVGHDELSSEPATSDSEVEDELYGACACR